MAIIKAVSSGASLGRIMAYIDKETALTAGKDCSDDRKQALSEMRTTKELWEKQSGRQYKHYIQSFSPHESNTLSPKQVNEICQKWANENFKGYEVFISTHTDRDHCHNHFVVNSVSYDTGKKIHLDKQALEHFKDSSDALCKELGLSVVDRNQKLERGEVRVYDTNKYQCIAQGKSYLAKTALDLNQALTHSDNPRTFIKAMQQQGYNVDWKDNRKNITLTTPDGKKIRTSNLAKTFNEPKFTKEGINHELIQNQQRQQLGRDSSVERRSRRTPDQKQRSLDSSEFRRRTGSNSIGESYAKESLRHIQRKLQNIKRRAIGSTIGNEKMPLDFAQQQQIAPKKQLDLGRGF